MSKHSIEITFTRLETVHCTYTSRITPEEAATLKACRGRDEQLELLETLGAGDTKHHMSAGDISVESVDELTDLESSDDEGITLGLKTATKVIERLRARNDIEVPADLTYTELGALLIGIGNAMCRSGLSFGAALDGQSRDDIAGSIGNDLDIESERAMMLAGLSDEVVLALLDKGI